MRLSKWMVVCVLAMLACFVAAGCGSDEDSGSENASSGASDGEQSGPLSGDELRGKSLVIATWGGHWTKATKESFGEPFAKETGVNVVYETEPDGFGTKIRAQEETGNVQWDLLDAAGEDVPMLRLEGMAEPFPAWLSNELSAKVAEEAVTDISLGGYGTSATLIACNPDLVQKCPRTAADFWDVDGFPGERAVLNYATDAVSMALQADGTPKDQLAEAFDVDAAFAKLEELKPHVRVWPASGDQQQQVMRDKEVGMAIMWSTRAFDLKNTSMPNLEIAWDSAVVASGGWVVPKGAPNKDVAFAFLDWFANHPEQQAKWTESVGAPTPGKEVPSLLPEDVAASMPAANDTVADPDFDAALSKAKPDIEQRWQSLLAGT